MKDTPSKGNPALHDKAAQPTQNQQKRFISDNPGAEFPAKFSQATPSSFHPSAPDANYPPGFTTGGYAPYPSYPEDPAPNPYGYQPQSHYSSNYQQNPTVDYDKLGPSGPHYGGSAPQIPRSPTPPPYYPSASYSIPTPSHHQDASFSDHPDFKRTISAYDSPDNPMSGFMPDTYMFETEELSNSPEPTGFPYTSELQNPYYPHPKEGTPPPHTSQGYQQPTGYISGTATYLSPPQHHPSAQTPPTYTPPALRKPTGTPIFAQTTPHTHQPASVELLRTYSSTNVPTTDLETNPSSEYLLRGGSHNSQSAPAVQAVEGPTLPKDFWNALQELSTQMLGPIAKVVLKKSVKKMGFKRSAFPQSKALELLTTISQKLSNSKREEFLKQGLEIINTFK